MLSLSRLVAVVVGEKGPPGLRLEPLDEKVESEDDWESRVGVGVGKDSAKEGDGWSINESDAEGDCWNESAGSVVGGGMGSTTSTVETVDAASGAGFEVVENLEAIGKDAESR